jgi:hypothetical protein
MATKEELMTPVEMPKMEGKEAKSFNDVIGIASPFMTKKSQVRTGITKAEGDILAGEQKQKEILAEGEKLGTEKQAEAIRTAQEKYKTGIEKEPIPAFIPTKDTVGDIAGLFSMINVMSMIAGKGNAQMALGNMNGMLEGYQKGRADLYKKEATEFDKNFKTVLKKHEELRKEMEDAIKLAPYDKEAAIAEASMAAVKAGSNIVKAKIDKGDLVGAYELVNDSQQLVTKAKENFDRHIEHVEAQAAADRRQREGFAHAERMQIASQKHAEAMQDASFKHAEKLAEFKKKTEASLGAKAFLQGTLGKAAPDEKTSQKIVDTALGVSQLDHVINLFRDPEVRTGVVSKLSSINEKLKSLGDNNHEISDDELKKIIDGAISPQAKNAVAQKEALFAAYTAEREIAGGRLLVSVVKQAGGALDPTNYEKEGYLNLVGGRRNELVKRLRGATLTDADISTVVSELNNQSRSRVEPPASAAAPPAVPAAPAAPPTANKPLTKEVADAANAAIANGAKREDVVKRLRDNGYDVK